MDSKFFGLFVAVFVFLTILGTSAESFYPLRYGKRGDQGAEGKFLKGVKYERRSDASPNNDLFYGSRYGKRSYNATPPDLWAEYGSSELGDRNGRSVDSEMSKNNKFYMGSRFGKRGHTSVPLRDRLHEWKSDEHKNDPILCRYTGFRHLYHCLADMEDPDISDSVF